MGTDKPPARNMYKKKTASAEKFLKLSVEDAENFILTRSDYDIVKVVDRLILLMGGPTGFADRIFKHCEASPDGGLIKTKIFDLIIRGLTLTTPKQNIKDDFGILTEEDLDRELRKVADIANANAKGQNDAPSAGEGEALGGSTEPLRTASIASDVPLVQSEGTDSERLKPIGEDACGGGGSIQVGDGQAN